MSKTTPRPRPVAGILLLSSLLSASTGCQQKRTDTSDFFGDDSSENTDETPPLVALDQPTNGATITGTMTWAATASDDNRVSSVTLYVDDVGSGLDVAEPWGGDWDSTEVANGAHTVKVVAADDAGNEADASASILVDNESGLDPDAILITNPTEAAEVCGDITVETQVSDEVAQVTFSLDGDEIELDTLAPFYWEWDTTTASDGDHQIQAIAADSEGREAVATVNVTVINEDASCDNKPSITITTPAEGDWLAGAQDVEVAASDDLGVVSVTFYVDSGLLTSDTAVPYKISLSTADFDDGAHLLKAVASDTGSQTAEDEITIYTDNTAPEVEITFPLDGATVEGTVAWTAEASDNIELTDVSFYLDDELVDSFDAEPFEVDLDTTALDYGAHELKVVGTDRAGNETEDVIDMLVDNPPVITYTSPTDTDVGGTVTVSATATDDDRVVSMTLSKDGTRVDESSRGEAVSTSFDTCDLAYGTTITMEASATDSGSNVSTEDLVLTVDQPTQVEIGEFTAALDYIDTLTASVSDDQTISRVVFALDGTTVATVTTATGTDDACFDCGCDVYSTTWSTASASEGTHTLSVTAYNAAGDTATDSTTITIDYDHDADGYDADFYGGDDCDDEDADHSPSTVETCDGTDEDCDGDTDEDFDVDGDGYLDETLCSSVAAGTDCDDSDATVYPGVVETCDGVDSNCDGFVDNYATYSSSSTTFSTNSHTLAYSGMYGNVYKATTNAIISTFQAYLAPGTGSFTTTWAIFEATSSTGDYTRVAYGTSTVSGSTGWFASPTLDYEMTSGRYYILGVGTSSTLTRYGDSTSPSLSSGSGMTLAGFSYSSSASATTITADPDTSKTYYQKVSAYVPGTRDADTDADGYSTYCGDCDDTSSTRSPDATETCNDKDDDCDGTVDDTTDADGDGEYACDDCDDTDADTYTGASEVCDSKDNDCDGTTDEDPTDGTTFYKDRDGDGYGALGTTDTLCSATTGWVTYGTDCDDSDSGVSPAASEACDGQDNDCDGSVDEGMSTTDADGDGYTTCEDCDDGDADVAPDATDVCEDGLDQNCDGDDAGCAYSGSYDLGSYGYKWHGKSSGDYLGYSVAAAGDIDGDGYGDVISGAYRDTNGGSYSGAAYIVFGPVTTSGVVSATGVAALTGVDGSDEAGFALAGVGDHDGDGYDDVFVSSPNGGSSGHGEAYLLFGPISGSLDLSLANTTIKGTSTNAFAGQDIADAGDVDDDGEPDLLIGAYGYSGTISAQGRIYLLSGPVVDDGDVSTATATFSGASTNDNAGEALAGNGDLDGDGYADMLFGVRKYGSSDQGATYAINGPVTSSITLSSADSILTGVSSNDAAGTSVALMDLDHDGYDDAVIGTPGRNVTSTDEGAVYVCFGPLAAGSSSLSAADLTISGVSSTASVGNDVSGGDVDGDGNADLVIGAPKQPDGGSQAGAAYLFFGPLSASTTTSGADASFIGEDTGDQLGTSVAIAPNVGGDGLGAVVMGAYLEDYTTSLMSGSFYVVPFTSIP